MVWSCIVSVLEICLVEWLVWFDKVECKHGLTLGELLKQVFVFCCCSCCCFVVAVAVVVLIPVTLRWFKHYCWTFFANLHSWSPRVLILPPTIKTRRYFFLLIYFIIGGYVLHCVDLAACTTMQSANCQEECVQKTFIPSAISVLNSRLLNLLVLRLLKAQLYSPCDKRLEKRYLFWQNTTNELSEVSPFFTLQNNTYTTVKMRRVCVELFC